MLVIGHRGAAGLAPENTLDALRAGTKAGADMLEFDVRLTKDGVPVLSHNPTLHGKVVRLTTLSELTKSGTVVTLNSVLDEFFGKILLNLEVKSSSNVRVIYDAIAKHIKSEDDWDNILVSSFHVLALLQLRKFNTAINLALLHSINPFAFITYNKRLQLSAVGWHRLHVNSLAIAIAKKADIFSYVYTVNRPQAAKILEQKGINAVVTDYPDRMVKNL